MIQFLKSIAFSSTHRTHALTCWWDEYLPAVTDLIGSKWTVRRWRRGYRRWRGRWRTGWGRYINTPTLYGIQVLISLAAILSQRAFATASLQVEDLITSTLMNVVAPTSTNDVVVYLRIAASLSLWAFTLACTRVEGLTELASHWGTWITLALMCIESREWWALTSTDFRFWNFLQPFWNDDLTMLATKPCETVCEKHSILLIERVLGSLCNLNWEREKV